MGGDRLLTVLSVAFSLAGVGPDAVGGAEAVLATMDRALVARGHRSVVVAQSGSVVAGALVPTPRVSGLIDEAIRARAVAATRAAMLTVLARESVDIVHLHGMDFAAVMPTSGVPVVVSVHLPASFHTHADLRPTRPATWLLPVSRAQAATLPDGPWTLPPIGNGVDVGALSATQVRRRDYCLMLSRICPEKGVEEALLAARAADACLMIGGQVYPYEAHETYFAERVRPLLDGRRRFLGPVAGGRKRRLIAGARCVLIPSLAAETSSLVAMEAAACGTPVVAFDAGALPETVEHGHTGLIVADWRAMADAIGRIGAIDPAACRAVARDRFSQAQMADEVIAVYRRIAHRIVA